MHQFEKAAENSMMIHDLDIRRWTLKGRDQVSLSPNLFNASHKWVYEFKRRHGIVSRKINKFVTRKSIIDKTKLDKEACEFVKKIKEDILFVGEENVFNSDQSGFNLEMHTGRSLSFKGQKQVEALAQSINSMTHSYTIQPIISATGVLVSPLLIVLKEKDGTFGPIVEKNLFKPHNTLILSSNSGKLTSELVKIWLEKVFLPSCKDKSVLLLDSWSGHNSKALESITKTKSLFKIQQIPSGTTGRV